MIALHIMILVIDAIAFQVAFAKDHSWTGDPDWLLRQTSYQVMAFIVNLLMAFIMIKILLKA